MLLWSTLLGSQVLQWILWALFLGLGLWWAKSPAIALSRLLMAAVTYHLANLGSLLAVMFAIQYLPALVPLLLLVYFCSLLVLPIVLVRRLFHLSWLRAIQALVPTLIVPVITLLLWLGVVRPYVLEAYVAVSNSMAPTLRGQHWRETCPTCGRTGVCSPNRAGEPLDPQKLMICEQFHTWPRPTDGSESNTVFVADRILVAKYRQPQRWDIVAFRHPAMPEQVYVMRLIGLPGETLVIKDGGVWVNDTRLTPPNELRDVVYLNAPPGFPSMDLSGTPDNPAELGDDEFFVLGDFSASASDSRWWSQGAPGYAPYAVPRSHIIGVVAQIYWPIERWRAF